MDMTRIDTLFGQRRPGHSLPQDLYIGTDAFDFDMAAIYGESWLAVGMECELPKTGSYISLMVGTWPVIIVRDKQGDIRAFHNSCRHRGSMICQPGSGISPKLVCPYHRWTYDLDGSLFAATRMGDEFDKAAHGLKPVAIENISGGLFICLSESPPPIDDFRDRLAAYAAPHNWKDLKLAHQNMLVEHANWKLVMENARECYHCPTGHPELATSFPVGMSKHFDTADQDAAKRFETKLDELGLLHEPVEGSWWQVARFPLNEGKSSISMDGQHVSKRLIYEGGDGDIGSMRFAVDPHSFSHSTADHVFLFSAVPISPTETHAYNKWYVHKDAVEGVDYHVPAMAELWDKTNLQDKELAENNHRGVNSRGYIPGPYSQEAEMLAQRFIDWYCDKARDYIESHAG